ncbi:MAG: flagellar basal body rod protein FlgB [Planctomycetota bacterium]|nr:MAG: flagellar basal body rod protein FlgB [Planctomycetota bacterium]
MIFAIFGAELGFGEVKMANWALWHGHCSFFATGRVLCAGTGRYDMSKTTSIVDIIEAGISAESLRQRVIANNVANLETAGYRRLDVRFEELLAKALNSSGGVDLGEIECGTYQTKNTPVKSNGNDVSLEVEVGEMVKNTLRHKALIRVLQKKYQQIDLAINVK